MRDWFKRLFSEPINGWDPYKGAFGDLVNIIFWGSLIIVFLVWLFNH